MAIIHEVYLTMVVATLLEPNSVPSYGKFTSPVDIDVFARPSFREQWLKLFLTHLNVPQTFFLGQDCDMITNLSKMLRDSILRCHDETSYLCAFIMIFKDHCSYNVVVNAASFFYAQRLPSRELVQNIACDEASQHSLPAGATTLERLEIQNEKDLDTCSICMEDFAFGDDAAKLPCSHVCHYYCILEWFVQRGTCPLCRFTCSHDT